MNESSIKRRRGRPKKEQAGFSETKAALIRTGMEILIFYNFCTSHKITQIHPQNL